MPLKNPSLIVVVDLNVLVSGATSINGAAWQVLEAWRDNSFQIAISEIMLTRLQSVLSYPKILALTRRKQADPQQFVVNLRTSALIVSGARQVSVSNDSEDDTLFACALEARAKYIVSGDDRHVLSIKDYQGIKTISPRDFVDGVLAYKKAA